jgi:flagellin
MGNAIQTNVASINARRNLSRTNNMLSTTLQRLSSGFRINSAKDDAAGLQISNRMTSQVGGLNQAVRNANDGISLAQTAEGALQESTNILQRMRDLSIQSANGTNSSSDRKALQEEIGQLQAEVTRIAETTRFGASLLLDGTFGTSAFQVGANSNESISMSLSNSDAFSLGRNSLDLGGSGIGVTQASNTVGAETVTINGSLGTAAITTVAGDSAKDIAEAINQKSSTTGVSADARSVLQLSGFTATGGTYSFTLNGAGTTVETIVGRVADGTKDLSSLADAINEVSGRTGITAVAENGTVTLVSESGDDIDIAAYGNADTISAQSRNFDNDANSGSAVSLVSGGTIATSATGQVRLDGGGDGFTIDGSSTTVTATANQLGSSLTTVASIDIATAEGAQKAISIVDGAISKIDSMRSSLGAIQNRLSNTISNLQNISENVSTARSRIRDTDFAEETATLSKTQVLQQAGLSMLSQANAQPQSILSLLQG